MRRFLIVLLGSAGLAALSAVSGCGGGGTPKTTVASVTVTPNIISLTKGQVVQVTAQPLDKDGKATTAKTVTFSMTPGSTSQSPANLGSISTNGLICAGTWDSTTNPVVCQTIADNPATPAVDEGVGTMTLTATADGVNSTPITVYIHESVVAISASLISTSNPAGPGGCVSQGTEARFTASVIGPGGSDITSTVGPIEFLSSAPSVAAVDTTVTPAPPATDQYFKANVPGQALIYARVSGTNGTATPLLTCSPASIVLSPASASLSGSGTQTLTATVVDINGVTLTSVPLSWSSAYSRVANVDATGKVTAGASPGVTYISAACAPPSCNLNEEKPEFGNLVKITVTGTATTPAVLVSSTATGVATPGTVNIVPINTSNNTTGTAVPFATGQIPNAMAFSQSQSSLWVSTNTGITTYNQSNNTFGTTGTGVKGVLLAVAPSDATAVVSDTTSGILHVITPTGADTQLNIPGATAAAYTPDSATIYIAAGGALYTYMPAFSSAPTQINLASGVTALDTSVLANGQVFFTAENSQFDVRATCDRTTLDTHAAAPLLLKSLPDGSQMIAADSASIWGIGVSWTPAADVVCAPSVTSISDAWNAYANPGGSFTPRQIIVTQDAKHVYITNDSNSLIAYDPATNAVSDINIGAATFTGGASADSSKVYVGAADGKVHVITTSNNTDTTQIAVSGICTGACLPDLVAVEPK